MALALSMEKAIISKIRLTPQNPYLVIKRNDELVYLIQLSPKIKPKSIFKDCLSSKRSSTSEKSCLG